MAFLARVFLPALGLGLICAVAWRYVPRGPLRTRLQIAAALLVLGTHPPVLLFLYQSIDLLVYQEAIFAFWGLVTAALMGYRLWRPDRAASFRQRHRSPVVVLIAGLVMGAMGSYFAWLFIGDVFLPRRADDGVVTGLKVNYGSRAPRLGYVFMNGQRHNITRDAIRELRIGDVIHAEFGAGSDTLLNFEKRGTRIPLPKDPVPAERDVRPL